MCYNEGKSKSEAGEKFMSEWNAALYDNKHDFVAEYGKGLLEFVSENNNQSILDLGCGTGILTVQLKKLADCLLYTSDAADE